MAETLKCPTCRSQSVADSEAPSAKAIRAEIARRLEAGESEDEIRDYLVSRFGEEILLTPSSSGVTGLVWVLPVVAVALGGRRPLPGVPALAAAAVGGRVRRGPAPGGRGPGRGPVSPRPATPGRRTPMLTPR